MAVAAEIRRPETEVYGRSLSTIHRLGAFMIGRPSTEIPDSPEAAQVRVEFYTSVEEGFGTDKELGRGLEVRDFDARPIINGKVMADDLKTPVSKMTEDGLVCAHKTYVKDEQFLPQLIRSEHDHINAMIVDEMASGKAQFNTRIVVSPFPEEAAARSGDAYWRNIGYVPHLKRGFVQLYHVTESGELLAGSLSFDGSNKERLREVFAKCGIHIPEDEVTDNWLQYAITDNLTAEQAQELALGLADELADPTMMKTTNTVDVTKQYKPVMDQVFNESYIHIGESLYRGRQTEMMQNLVHQFADKAHHYNTRYARSLYKIRANPESFTDDDAAVLHELLVYSTIEMMRALHLKTADSIAPGANVALQAQGLNPSQLQMMLSSFAADGAKNNRGYSACGLAIALGDENVASNRSDDPLNPQEAFGGNGNKSEKGEGVGKIGIGECVVPNCPTSPRKVLVGGCGVCLGRCQKLFDQGYDPSKMKAPLGSILGKVIDTVLGNRKKKEEQTKPQKHEAQKAT